MMGRLPAPRWCWAATATFTAQRPTEAAITAAQSFQLTPAGVLTTLHTFGGFDNNGDNGDGAQSNGLVQGSDGDFYGTTPEGGSGGEGTVFRLTLPPAFFTGEAELSNGVCYLSFASGGYFGYYSFLSDPHYIYHFDLGYEYVFDANDGKAGIYLYDFASQTFFYTSPVFPFPYLYDFTLNSVLYYYPDPTAPRSLQYQRRPLLLRLCHRQNHHEVTSGVPTHRGQAAGAVTCGSPFKIRARSFGN